MYFFRKSKYRKTVSLFFLFVFVQSLTAPYYAMALTTGPEQVDYQNFSEPGKTDMVDLLTGDFSFDLPILSVPGPEGSFDMPLTYQAGIALDQEASWVGLGWSLNAGAIARTVNEFPDDASGESNSITVQDLEGLRGWDARALGIGKMGWNNSVGHFGSISVLSIINAEWSEDHSSVGLVGVNVTDKGFVFNPVQFVLGVITIASWGAAGAAAGAGSTYFQEVGKQAVIGLASSSLTEGAVSLFTGSGLPNAPTAGSWEYSKVVRKSRLGFLRIRDYKIWLDKARNERMYGTLYLGNAPLTPLLQDGSHLNLAVTNGGVSQTLYSFTNESNDGGASDMNYQLPPNDELKNFQDINSPAVLAPDNFSVKAAGISGSMAPYRLDIGSVSMPRAMEPSHIRLSPLPFLPNDETYKVPFVYDGQPSGGYFHHAGGETSVSAPKSYFGIHTQEVNLSLTYILDDVAFKDQRIAPSISNTKKIPQSRYIEWLSNDEIKSGITYSSKFMDYYSGGTGTSVSPNSDRYNYRTYTPSAVGAISIATQTSNFSTTIPIDASNITKFTVGDVVDLDLTVYNYPTGTPSTTFDYDVFQVIAVNSTSPYSITLGGDARLSPFSGKTSDITIQIHKTNLSGAAIGGFAITSPNGLTYHFALAVNDYDQFTEVHDILYPNTKKSTITRKDPFGNTWLLTGITGPDFIDRNENGVIDQSDWGHWVKLNYGLSTDDFKWRIPYQGFRKLESGTHETFTQGKKQLVYLNSIETRSHIALFVKSPRFDGKSQGTVERFPLKLDEIILVSQNAYSKLIRESGEGGFGLTDLTNKTNRLLTAAWINGPARDFVNKNCLKRILFTYSYLLTPGTLNSNMGGKLTLEKLSILGRNSLKIVPDYKFGYGANPNYNEDHWDYWGMFNNGGDARSPRSASSNDSDGSAWSMNTVTTPLGAEISVAYERDTFSSVSGLTISNEPISFSNINFDLYFPTNFPSKRITLNNPANYVAVGDSVNVQGYATYTCSTVPGSTLNKVFNSYAKVVAVGSNYIELNKDYMEIPCSLSNSGEYVHVEAQVGSLYPPLKNRKGGELRVNSITVKDEFDVENKVRYVYKNDDGTSSGVVSRMPYLSESYYFFTTYLGYPQTPVLYKKVAVLGGKLTTENDFVSKHIYEFETPHHSQLTLKQSVVRQAEHVMHTSHYDDYLTVFWNRYDDRTNSIGRLNSVKVYDKNQILTSSTSMIYTDQMLNDGVNNYQGFYTKGTLMFDRVTDGSDQHHKASRTTVIQYPSVLKKVITSKDGMTTKTENLGWDFVSGAVTDKLQTSPLGISTRSISKPAYMIYPELGPKSLNVNNKHILVESAATYTYRSNAAGEKLGLIGATAQTWQKDWTNYRENISGLYQDASSSPAPVWRKAKGYVFIGDVSSLQEPYGTQSFTIANEFNFSSTNPLWQFVSENLRFDHFSMPLESVDKDGIYSSIKMGYDNRSRLAAASNAKYNEIAFSSAEDKIANESYFGGEVGLGSGTVVSSQVHTGASALSVSSGYGFVFKSSDISTNKTYKASVWTNSVNGRIYYKLNGGSEVIPNSQTISQPVAVPGNGNWYRIDVNIVNPTSSTIEIGVKSSSGTVIFDDFRFQPFDAVMTCYVIPPLDFEFTADPGTYSPEFSYVLDNDNLFTKIESNEKGEQVKVYSESITYGVKLISESKTNYRRNTVNQ